MYLVWPFIFALHLQKNKPGLTIDILQKTLYFQLNHTGIIALAESYMYKVTQFVLVIGRVQVQLIGKQHASFVSFFLKRQ